MSAARPRPSGRARHWSWNRLADDAAAGFVESSEVPPGALVLDLGAGDGAVTQHLLAAGARVIAFELHPERIATLRRRFRRDDVTVVRADVRDLRLPTRSFRVVANPPFDGVNAVLVRLTHRASRLERADLLLPKAVARSWSKRLERTGFAMVRTLVVPRSSFRPRPRIDVVHATIVRRRGR